MTWQNLKVIIFNQLKLTHVDDVFGQLKNLHVGQKHISYKAFAYFMPSPY